jgi:hypothetical protein
MDAYNSKFYRWLFSTPYRALHRAYIASKRVRNIQRDYLFYKNTAGGSRRRSFYQVNIYIESILNQSISTIFWSLFEFKLSIKLCNLLASLQLNSFFLLSKKKARSNDPKTNWQDNTSFLLTQRKYNPFFNTYTRSFKQEVRNWINIFADWAKDRTLTYFSDNISFPSSLQQNCRLIKQLYKKNLDVERWSRKLTWVEAVLSDLEVLKNTGYFSSEAFSGQRDLKKSTPLNISYNAGLFSYMDSAWLQRLPFGESWGQRVKNLNSSQSSSGYDDGSFPQAQRAGSDKVKDTAYESLGLVPRSITRTLSRFQTELAGRSASLVLPEFRLAKYQAITSLKFLCFLILFPFFTVLLCKIFILEPIIEHWWNTSQFQIFLSSSQEEKALKRLQEVEELLWLDIIMADSSEKQPQDLSAQIHQRTINLVETYNQESIQTILHFFTNFLFIFVVVSLLIWGKKRLAILNSWVQEVFYSLSDTMKAFFILLFTDLCIGFHSPHGWEILIGLLLEHLGFSHNKHVISCFVSTFPVILDTVFKYWIFRHLNRISPSIVVSYHTMNE